MTARPVLVLFWENFGPGHLDRLAAVSAAMDPTHDVVGLQFRARSDTYAWDNPATPLRLITLFGASREPGLFGRIRALWEASRRIGRGTYVLGSYDWPDVFVFAWLLRLQGNAVYCMGCSKADDKPRHRVTERLKAWWLRPYTGAIGNADRSLAYFRALGLPPERVVDGYNTLDIKRLRALAGRSTPPTEADGRTFIAIARFVPKKNLGLLLQAYARYHQRATAPRPLVLCGDGPLAADLRAQAKALGIAEAVRFTGFLQAPALARELDNALALCLPSTEEQFGNVVIEALALGVPSIASAACGACDKLVRNGETGWVIAPSDPEHLAARLLQLDADPALWRHMARAAFAMASSADASRFAAGIRTLVNGHG